MRYNVVFPMAGLGSRFNYQFKPFIKATEFTFIELAKQPFDALPEKEFYFIFRQSQEDSYQVSATLKHLFPKDKIHLCIIKDTDGPLQTLQEAIKNYNITGPSFVCDCDHKIDISDMLEHTNSVVVPVWNITPEQYPNWGKVKIENHKLYFCEKEFIIGENIKGLIGCYLFKTIQGLLDYPPYENISSILNQFTDIQLVEIKKAEFFGTPALLEQFRFERAKKYTLFMDIDGTILHQETKKPLPNALEQIHLWKSQGHKIILTTACCKEKMEMYISDIPHDHIIYNITPGPRYIMNDRKPYNPTFTMAEGIQVTRNEGLTDISLPDKYPIIVKKLTGGSLTHTYLMKDDAYFIRKYGEKEHASTLKRQVEDIKRLNFYIPNICPKILAEHHGTNDYYYDLEYLTDYQTLSHFDESIIYNVMFVLLKKLDKHLYCYRRYLSPLEKRDWMDAFLQEKIFSKKKYLTCTESILLNNKPYQPVLHYLKDVYRYAPDYICPIHGDLSFENIMYNQTTNDYKLIDPAGSRYMDAPEQDLGKILQSLVVDYAHWNPDTELIIYNQNCFGIPEKYFNHTYEKLFEKYHISLFYMAMHLIRMIPYAKNKKSGLFAELLAIYYLSSLCDTKS